MSRRDRSIRVGVPTLSPLVSIRRVSSGTHPIQSFGKESFKSWEPFTAPQLEEPNQSSFSLPIEASTHRSREHVTLSEPLLDQGRPSSLVLGARMAAKIKEVPGTAPLLPLIKASNEIFPIAGQRKSGTVVGKGRKINKEKLKAVLAAIDCYR